MYIDLYAGAGYARVKGTKKILKGSPILALTVSHPFDKYIFCEESEELLDALKARVARLSPRAQTAYIQGSCDVKIEQICKEIPKVSQFNNRQGENGPWPSRKRLPKRRGNSEDQGMTAGGILYAPPTKTLARRSYH